MPSVERVRHELRLRLLEVADVEDVAPRLRRFTFTGDLAGFASASPDDHVKLIFPAPGEEHPRLPELGPDGLRREEGRPPPIMRDYTPRAFDVAAGTLTIDMVLHGDGPAATWAATARPGSVLGQAGPRGSRVASADFDWWLLAGDEAAIPSIARRLEELPAGARAFVLIEVDGEEDEIPLPSAAAAERYWLHRLGAEPGTSGALEHAISDLVLPGGEGFAWVGCEAEVARRLRRHLRDGRGLPKAYTKVTGYWKRGSADHHDPPEEDA
jgi:NADPH-dependent ferric siderophore reductase